MTKTQRIMAIALSGVLLLSGFAFGRLTSASPSAAAENTNQPVANSTQPSSSSEANKSAAYLVDYQTGYREGYNSGLAGQETTLATVSTNAAYSERVGYGEGFKLGFADGYRMRGQSGSTLNEISGISYAARPVVYRQGRTVYREGPTRVVYRERKRRGGSKLKTALTIAAPAAIGAGIGGIAKGGKGAGIGALIGGGGGALYHLLKKRD